MCKKTIDIKGIEGLMCCGTRKDEVSDNFSLISEHYIHELLKV